MLKRCFITAVVIVVIGIIIATIAENCREKIPVETEEEAINIAKEVLGDDGTIEFAYKVFEYDNGWYVISNYDPHNREYYEENYVGHDPLSKKSKRISSVTIRKKDGKIIEKGSEYIHERIYIGDHDAEINT